MYYSISKQSKGFAVVAVSLLTSLLLLINLSFKIVYVSGLMFTSGSLLSPFLTLTYLYALKELSLFEQRHILNIGLLALYIFSIGVYITMHLPVGDSMHDSMAYQIVFEELPRKFFATTFAFGLCFYLPHLIIFPRRRKNPLNANTAVILALFSGLSFFFVNFYFLFTEPALKYFNHILFDSFLICITCILLGMVAFLLYMLARDPAKQAAESRHKDFPVFEYLLAFTLIIMMICVACEYRVVKLFDTWAFTANSLIFPFAFISATMISELFGFKAVYKMLMFLLLGNLFFELLLMLIVNLPSPAFFNINTFYTEIMPRRIPAGLISATAVFLTNAWLIDVFKRSSFIKSRALRLFSANFIACLILVFVSYYSLLSGVFHVDLLLTLALNAWIYKNLLIIIFLPVMVYLCRVCDRYLSKAQAGIKSSKPALA